MAYFLEKMMLYCVGVKIFCQMNTTINKCIWGQRSTLQCLIPCDTYFIGYISQKENQRPFCQHDCLCVCEGEDSSPKQSPSLGFHVDKGVGSTKSGILAHLWSGNLVNYRHEIFLFLGYGFQVLWKKPPIPILEALGDRYNYALPLWVIDGCL